MTAARVRLPFENASIHWTATVAIPLSVQEFRQRAQAVAAAWRLSDAARSDAANLYAGALVDAMAAVADSPACHGTTAAPTACNLAFDTEMASVYRQTLGQKTPSAEDVKAIRAVDARLRSFVSGLKPVTVDAKASFRNRPPTRASLGLGTGVVLAGGSNGTRAKMSGGTLEPDPLPRQFTMVLVNVGFEAYDPDAFRVSSAERYRAFAGAFLTPDFGVGGGLSVLLARGFAANIGLGLLFSRAAGESAVGKAPEDPADPFVLGTSWAAVVGVSYNFK